MQRELSSLRKDLKSSLRSAYSTGTFSNLRTQFSAFLLFCSYFEFKPLPAELDTVCLYVQFLSRTLSPPSIRNYLSGVKLFHLFSGLEYSFSKEFVLSLALRGIARAAQHTPLRAPCHARSLVACFPTSRLPTRPHRLHIILCLSVLFFPYG